MLVVSCTALPVTGAASTGAKLIFSPSQRWPHQHTPSALMMQVPVPQHLGSSLIKVLQGLAVASPVIGNGTVIEIHFGASQGTVLGGAPLHACAPHAKRAGLEFSTHQANHFGLAQTHTFVNGLKRGAPFESQQTHPQDSIGQDVVESSFAWCQDLRFTNSDSVDGFFENHDSEF